MGLWDDGAAAVRSWEWPADRDRAAVQERVTFTASGQVTSNKEGRGPGKGRPHHAHPHPSARG